MHPLEDFAEVFAHFLHIADAVQSAAVFGLLSDEDGVVSDVRQVPLVELVEATWLPLTRALNQLNRSMGRDDLYPFVLPAAVIDKLGFVHELVVGR